MPCSALRVAVVGGDDRAHLQEWPDSLEVTTYNGTDSDVRRVVASAQAGGVDKVVLLVRWLSHGLIDMLKRNVNVPILPWQFGVHKLSKEIASFVDPRPPADKPNGVSVPANGSCPPAKPPVNVDVATWESLLMDPLSIGRYTLHEVFQWADVQEGTEQADSVVKALDELVQCGKLETENGLYWATTQPLSQHELAEAFSAVMAQPTPALAQPEPPPRYDEFYEESVRAIDALDAPEPEEEPVEDKKTCRGPCGLEKPLSAFNKGSGAFGRSTKCKDCRHDEYVQRRIDNGRPTKGDLRADTTPKPAIATKVTKKPAVKPRDVIADVVGEWLVQEGDEATHYNDKVEALEALAENPRAVLWRRVKTRTRVEIDE